MSIYCSRVVAGQDTFPDERRGHVVAYPDNDLRRVARRGWPQGAIFTAHIPHWCVPGHEEGDACRYQDDDVPVAGWLRISVKTAGAWVDVLADREAVQALRDDMSAWLAMRHVDDADERIE